MKSVALHNLGCKVNNYELDVMQQMLQEKGYKIVPFDERADIYIVNTCTVTNIADRKSRQMLHRARKINPQAVVVAVGCYVQTGKDRIVKDGTVDLAIGNNRKKDLIMILENYLSGQREAQETGETAAGAGLSEPDAADERADTPGLYMIDINHTCEYEEMTLKRTAEHTRAYIKIQDGCNQFCSYCVIPYARGRVRSRRQEDVLREVQGIAGEGYQEIVLTGIHISSYGMDRGGCELLPLLEKLHEIEGIKRIRLGSLEPRIVTEEFALRISGMPKVCPHFHLSLQSGSDSVLRRMNRRYDSEEYFRATAYLRRFYENPAITTDVIVGFPGETQEEFQETEDFLRRVNFFEMHIFKYSKRQGTRAAEMEGQLTEAEKGRRSTVLMETERQMSRTYRAGFIGRQVEVLFEEKQQMKDGQTYWIGHTTQYIKAAKAALDGENLHNKILSSVIRGFLEEDVMLV
jgi:threonylcarbamoyladenosine tRNA methylthiotransferase MtaB